MGEVWRAKDTRLDRDVAIKVLPEAFAKSAQFLARFEREAKAISSLNHPHICTLHDVGHENGLHYLVMELIQGESLAERLARGPLPIEQVLRYGAQIADALDAAHRRDVIHRDLKPGNIMLTKAGAKLLDFGLAKSNSGLETAVPGYTAATQHKPITEQGTILGTFQYMSPEQLEGVEVDCRTDIFALGAVLYEMATGRRAFQGSTRTSLIASIVSTQPPPIATIAPMTPPAFEHVVRKCLEKDPDERWQSARDVASELRWISEAGSQAGVSSSVATSRRSRKMMLAALAITGWVAAIAAAMWVIRDRAKTAPALELFRSDLVVPSSAGVAFVNAGPISLSKDGQQLAYTRRDPGGLAVHDFKTGRFQLLEGTAGATFPFWSPDGRWIGFFSQGKLKKVEIAGGAVHLLCSAREGRGGTWSQNGTILFAPDIIGPLMKVPEEGGTPVAVTRVPDARYTHRNPHFLPDGEHFLFTARQSRLSSVGEVAMASLAGGEGKIIATGSNPQYAEGHLFYFRDQNLIAQRMDGTAGAVGPPNVIAQRVEYFNPRDVANFAVSAGQLVFRQRVFAPTQLTWVDRAGGILSTVGDPGLYAMGRANFGANVATLVRRDDADQESIWVMDLKRGTVTRSTENFTGALTRAIPDASGQQIAVSTWANEKLGISGVWIQAPSATGAHKVLVGSSTMLLEDWSRDGKVIVGNSQEAGTGFDIVWLSVDDPKKINVFAGSRYNEQSGRLSPNGRWIAYTSDEGGTRETYVSDFPAGRNRWQVTRSGGQPNAWTADGRELIVGAEGQRSAYPITENGDSIDIGAPVRIVPVADGLALVGTDGPRLLILRRVAEATEEPLRIVRNWRQLVKK